MFEGFETGRIDGIFFRYRGSGPPLLLLHGFPETHLMWRDIAPRLASQFTVVCADLRGYGASSCRGPYSKRAMAYDLVEVMSELGFQEFALAGHDRGGRVAYRLALDHPKQVAHLAVLDVIPTAEAWARADARFATAFWPWSLLAQDEPLPERLLAAAPAAVVDNALTQWGSPKRAFTREVRQAYIDALNDPEHVHAICEEYRAAATIDREYDETDRRAGRHITCPVLVLWSAPGPLGTWYEDIGGPLAIWRQWAGNVVGHAVNGGHFFPEELPAETAAELLDFFRS